MFEAKYSNYEVIFVDNNSTDDSVRIVESMFGANQRLRVILNGKNLGFAEGNNIGVKYAKGKYLVFLNNDTEVDPSWLLEISKVFSSDRNIAAAQCKLLQLDDRKTLESAGHYIDYFGIAHIRGENEVDLGQYDNVDEIFGATGAAFIVRSDVFNEVKGFDSDYFLTFEETDLCWRILERGYKIVFIPKAEVFHKGRGTRRSTIANDKNVYLFCRNRLTSMIKNYSAANAFRFIPINISILVIHSANTFAHHDDKSAKAIINAINWNIVHLNDIINKRRIVQSMRKKSDNFLFNNGLIEQPNIKRIFAKSKTQC